MRIAYVFATQNGSYILEKMILPQLEAGNHGVDVVGMFFFVDNNYMLEEGNPTALRLKAVAEKNGMMVMGCDQCCELRRIDEKIQEPFTIGCFPNLYGAIQEAGGLDQVITL
ncbi:DsrE-related protein [Thioalkalivibrio thiocyanodenitrificans]|uniref:DsrE-related protein n=1 Tax=Thioalkalivibrio thiocyanodenitrificans TaxID=243063 RepID=UPI0003788D44|nr:DsrE-related protein [Thioalkalivibrio thiocyanodenitrificans]